MARTGIRFEDVRDAAESLLARGLNPTIQRVRELLGTGSNTTISEHLKSWQQQLAETPKLVLPPTVPEAVMAALDAFWKIAVQHAEAAFEEQRLAALHAVAEAEQTRDAALAEQRQARAEATEVRQKLAATQTTARELADRLLVEQERRAAAETAVQTAEQGAREAAATVAQIRAETSARVAQLETTLQQARADLERQQTESQRQLDYERQRGAANEARLLQQLDRERAEYTDEKQKLMIERQNWRDREATLREKLERNEREQTELRVQLSGAQERLHQLTAELDAARAAALEHAAQHREIVRALDVASVRLDAEIALRQRLEQELEELRALLRHRLADITDSGATTVPSRDQA
ncbi:MAG TPA: hypothetical protein GX399_12690 [Xanthomonadaceae bacterium]|nr:hypothetical protein [Xanthomonadaceae bacterium]